MPMTEALPAEGAPWQAWATNLDTSIRDLETNGIRGAGQTGYITVASADLPADIKADCDYVCTGTNDQTTINLALQQASRPADGFGGDGRGGVQLVGPSFYVGHNNSTSITMYPGTSLWGIGTGTLLQPNYSSGTTRGVIELLNSDVRHVRLGNFTISRPTAGRWYGHGIKLLGRGTATTSPYEIKSGGDFFCQVTDVNVHFSHNRACWITGPTSGAKATLVSRALLWSASQSGLYVEADDFQGDQLTCNGGGDDARFWIAGKYARVTNSKSYFAGNSTGTGGGTVADGWLITADMAVISGCSAQDNGRWGFRFQGQFAVAEGLVADSNQRSQTSATSGGGFEIAGPGVYDGLHGYDRGQSANHQRRNFVFVNTPLVELVGRSKLLAADQTAALSPGQISGTPHASSHVEIVRADTTPYLIGA